MKNQDQNTTGFVMNYKITKPNNICLETKYNHSQFTSESVAHLSTAIKKYSFMNKP